MENKSIKQKSMEDLQEDMQAMQDYKQEQLEVVERGNAAASEIVKRLGNELNFKAGTDLYVEKKGLEAISKASRKQYDPGTDVILVAIVVDNTHAQNDLQKVNETKAHSLIQQTLENQLPGGTKLSTISLKAMEKDNVRAFADAFTRMSTAASLHNKTTAALIQKEYKHTFPFNPGKYMPE